MLPSIRQSHERVGLNLDGPFEWDGCLVLEEPFRGSTTSA